MPKRKLNKKITKKVCRSQGQTSTWALALKKSPKETKNKPTRTMRWNHHLLVAHGCSSHLLTPTSWWASQKRVSHNRTHNKESRV